MCPVALYRTIPRRHSCGAGRHTSRPSRRTILRGIAWHNRGPTWSGRPTKRLLPNSSVLPCPTVTATVSVGLPGKLPAAQSVARPSSREAGELRIGRPRIRQRMSPLGATINDPDACCLRPRSEVVTGIAARRPSLRGKPWPPVAVGRHTKELRPQCATSRLLVLAATRPNRPTAAPRIPRARLLGAAPKSGPRLGVAAVSSSLLPRLPPLREGGRAVIGPLRPGQAARKSASADPAVGQTA